MLRIENSLLQGVTEVVSRLAPQEAREHSLKGVSRGRGGSGEGQVALKEPVKGKLRPPPCRHGAQVDCEDAASPTHHSRGSCRLCASSSHENE